MTNTLIASITSAVACRFGLILVGLLAVGCPKSDEYQHPISKSDGSARRDTAAGNDHDFDRPQTGNIPTAGANSSDRSRTKDTGGLFADYPEAFLASSSDSPTNRPPPKRSPPQPEPASTVTRPFETRPQPEPKLKPPVVRPPLPKPPTKTMEELLIDLKSTDPNVRFRAAMELGSRGSEAQLAVPALRAATRDPSDQVRIAAESALRKIGG